MRVDDFVIVQMPGGVRGKWNVGRVIMFPGHDSGIRNVKVKKKRLTQENKKDP